MVDDIVSSFQKKKRTLGPGFEPGAAVSRCVNQLHQPRFDLGVVRNSSYGWTTDFICESGEARSKDIIGELLSPCEFLETPGWQGAFMMLGYTIFRA